MKTQSLAIFRLNPNNCSVDSAQCSIDIEGSADSGFTADTKAYLIDGTEAIALDTEFANGQALKAVIPAERLRKDTVMRIKVCTVTAAGKIDKEGNEVDFPVGTPNPVITKVIPAQIFINNEDTTPLKVMIAGKNFHKAEIMVNNQRLTGLQVRNSQCMEIDVPRKFLKKASALNFVVINVGTDPKESNPQEVKVVDPATVAETVEKTVEKRIEDAVKEEKKEKKKWKLLSIIESGLIIASIIVHVSSFSHKPEAEEKPEQPKTEPAKPTDGAVKGIFLVEDLALGQSESIPFEQGGNEYVTIQPGTAMWAGDCNEDFLLVDPKTKTVLDTIHPHDNKPLGPGDKCVTPARYLGPGSKAFFTVTRTEAKK